MALCDSPPRYHVYRCHATKKVGQSVSPSPPRHSASDQNANLPSNLYIRLQRTHSLEETGTRREWEGDDQEQVEICLATKISEQTSSKPTKSDRATTASSDSAASAAAAKKAEQEEADDSTALHEPHEGPMADLELLTRKKIWYVDGLFATSPDHALTSSLTRCCSTVTACAQHPLIYQSIAFLNRPILCSTLVPPTKARGKESDSDQDSLGSKSSDSATDQSSLDKLHFLRAHSNHTPPAFLPLFPHPLPSAMLMHDKQLLLSSEPQPHLLITKDRESLGSPISHQPMTIRPGQSYAHSRDAYFEAASSLALCNTEGGTNLQRRLKRAQFHVWIRVHSDFFIHCPHPWEVTEVSVRTFKGGVIESEYQLPLFRCPPDPPSNPASTSPTATSTSSSSRIRWTSNGSERVGPGESVVGAVEGRWRCWYNEEKKKNDDEKEKKRREKQAAKRPAATTGSPTTISNTGAIKSSTLTLAPIDTMEPSGPSSASSSKQRRIECPSPLSLSSLMPPAALRSLRPQTAAAIVAEATTASSHAASSSVASGSPIRPSPATVLSPTASCSTTTFSSLSPHANSRSGSSTLVASASSPSSYLSFSSFPNTVSPEWDSSPIRRPLGSLCHYLSYYDLPSPSQVRSTDMSVSGASEWLAEAREKRVSPRLTASYAAHHPLASLPSLPLNFHHDYVTPLPPPSPKLRRSARV